ncbi:MAG: hypothetical protein U1E53_04705 [Dongiaceae bacterium]
MPARASSAWADIQQINLLGGIGAVLNEAEGVLISQIASIVGNTANYNSRGRIVGLNDAALDATIDQQLAISGTPSAPWR